MPGARSLVLRMEKPPVSAARSWEPAVSWTPCDARRHNAGRVRRPRDLRRVAGGRQQSARVEEVDGDVRVVRDPCGFPQVSRSSGPESWMKPCVTSRSDLRPTTCERASSSRCRAACVSRIRARRRASISSAMALFPPLPPARCDAPRTRTWCRENQRAIPLDADFALRVEKASLPCPWAGPPPPKREATASRSSRPSGMPALHRRSPLVLASLTWSP